jgi:hypothetical protein
MGLLYVGLQYEDSQGCQCPELGTLIQLTLDGKPMFVYACIGHFRDMVPYDVDNLTAGKCYCTACIDFQDSTAYEKYPLER